MSRFPHLKTYVREHPENKMAWYLLGKEYEADGQPGKANYCFNQAQEVYEAYEHVHVPEDILAEYEQKLHEAADKRARRAAKQRNLLLLAVLLLLAGFRYASAPGMGAPLNAAENVLAVDGNNMPPALFTAAETGQPDDLGEAAAAYLRDGREVPASVLGMERDGEWLIWKKGLPVIAEIEPGEGSSESLLRSYDPKTCDCEADVSNAQRKMAQAWMDEQESLAVLASAIGNYRAGGGGIPDSLEELNGTFPNNVLSGSTPAMKRSFAAMTTMLKRQAYGQESAPLSEGGRAVSAATLGGKPYLEQPLEIVIDRARHRLAVVSGNVILRNYEVGLGGSKTPTGSYVVSDKVVNPNGKSNGDFGSRGMQLSDTDYAIHGTNDLDSIGADVSHGCVRMSNDDVEELFDMVPAGTKVTLADNVLPEEKLVPKTPFKAQDRQDQTNNKKVYRWLD